MSRELPGLPGVTPVQTSCFARAQIVLRRAVEHRDIALLSGDAGCGKTYAVERFLTSRTMDGLSHTWLEMPPKPAPKEVVARTLEAITGSVNHRLPQYALTDQLVEQLSGSGHVLIIDEAHNLKTQGLQQLRYLHQRGEFSWTLVLAGASLAETISGAMELATRADGLARFEPLSRAELLAALAAWHPLLAKSSPAMLRHVDQEWGRGNFRRWAKFLRTAIEFAPRMGVDHLTDKLVSAALTAQGADAWRVARS